jgi:hypothetical protein
VRSIFPVGRKKISDGDKTMSGEMSRREFLSRRGLGEVFRKVTPMLGIKSEPEQLSEPAESPEVKETETVATEERTVMDGYLSSPLYSYALLSEMPWDMLVEEARRRGIPYDGRSKMEVVRELFVGAEEREE